MNYGAEIALGLQELTNFFLNLDMHFYQLGLKEFCPAPTLSLNSH